MNQLNSKKLTGSDVALQMAGGVIDKGLRYLVNLGGSSNGVNDPTLSAYGQERTGKQVANFGLDVVETLIPLLLLI